VSEERDPLQLYAYVQKGIAGAPEDVHGVHVTGEIDDTPKPIAGRTEGGLASAGYSYWAVFGPECLLHIYYEGPLPNEARRDAMNQQLYGLALVTLQRWAEEDAEC
jgi:hypothetical protein